MKRNLPTYAFALLSLCYLALSILQPADPTVLEHYHVSQLQLRIIDASILLPLQIIWVVALVGAVRFKDYAKVIHTSKEGGAFTLLARGLMVLVYGLPISGIIASLFSYLNLRHPDLLPTAIITRNYTNLILALLPFFFLASGARLLVLSSRRSEGYQPALPGFIAPIIILMNTSFTWLVMTSATNHQSGQNAYYLPNWLIASTLVVPYIVTWVWGILATYYLYWYKAKLRGTIYKQAFGDIANGIAVVTGISVFIQFLSTISTQLNALQLPRILALIYFLVALYAVGFVYIARGSTKLKRIEEA